MAFRTNIELTQNIIFSYHQFDTAMWTYNIHRNTFGMIQFNYRAKDGFQDRIGVTDLY